MDNSRAPHNGHSADGFDLLVDEVTCRQFVELVTDYFEGQLEERSLTQVEAHLVMCHWCVTYMAQMRTTLGLLRALGESSSPEPPEEVLSALRARRAGGA